MRRLIRNLLLFALPAPVLLAAYVWADPFKAVRHYDCYYRQGDFLGVNRGMVSAYTYEQQRHQQHYDSFIFGNSRSMAFKVDEWMHYLPADSRPYHFDASAESLQGLLCKLRYIDSVGESLRNVLIVCDTEMLGQLVPGYGHLFITPPLLATENNTLNFQGVHFSAFLNPKFLLAFADFSLFHQYRPYMHFVIVEAEESYDITTNELLQSGFEESIRRGDFYNAERCAMFEGVQHPDSVQRPVIGPEHEQMLRQIASIMEKHRTNCRVVVGPLYDQVRLNPKDLQLLKDIFGESNVQDFSGVNEWNVDYHNYYEQSHYRIDVASEVMRRIYQPDTARQHRKPIQTN